MSDPRSLLDTPSISLHKLKNISKEVLQTEFELALTEQTGAWRLTNIARTMKDRNIDCLLVGSQKWTPIAISVNVVNLDPTISLAWFNLGLWLDSKASVLLQNGEEATKQYCYVKSIETDPTDGLVWYNLGVASASDLVAVSGERLTKQQIYLKAIHYSPNYSYAWYNLGLTLTYDSTVTLLDGVTVMTRLQIFLKVIDLYPTYQKVWRSLDPIVKPGETVKLLNQIVVSKEDIESIVNETISVEKLFELRRNSEPAMAPPAPSISMQSRSGDDDEDDEFDESDDSDISGEAPNYIHFDPKRIIPFSDLELIEAVANGAYGRVWRARWFHSQIAVKEPFFNPANRLDEMARFDREASVMLELPPHPHVITTYGISRKNDTTFLAVEWCEKGSVESWFKAATRLSFETKLAIIRDAALGLQHLHKFHVIHRDIAARNILLGNDYKAKICDFGYARTLTLDDEVGRTVTRIGPVRWMAPESLARLEYSTASDVYSFGKLIYEILKEEYPLKDIPDLKTAAKRIVEENLTPQLPADCPQFLREICHACWAFEPSARPNMRYICDKLVKNIPQK